MIRRLLSHLRTIPVRRSLVLTLRAAIALTTIAAVLIRHLLEVLDTHKVVIILCLVFALFVTLPNQTLELYRSTAQSLAESYYLPSHSVRGALESVFLIASVI